MSRIFDSLSARLIICTSLHAVFKCSIVAPLRSIHVLDLSSLSFATNSATLFVNSRQITSSVISSQSSIVSCKIAALMISSSSVIDATILPTSNGCTIYGLSVPFRTCPSCACVANIIAFSITSIPSFLPFSAIGN